MAAQPTVATSTMNSEHSCTFWLALRPAPTRSLESCRQYWLGLQQADGSNVFSTSDPLLAATRGASSYSHWGLITLEDGSELPTPGTPGYQCSVANASMAFGSQLGMTTGLQAWGWADQDCAAQHVALCRLSRK